MKQLRFNKATYFASDFQQVRGARLERTLFGEASWDFILQWAGAGQAEDSSQDLPSVSLQWNLMRCPFFIKGDTGRKPSHRRADASG